MLVCGRHVAQAIEVEEFEDAKALERCRRNLREGRQRQHKSTGPLGSFEAVPPMRLRRGGPLLVRGRRSRRSEDLWLLLKLALVMSSGWCSRGWGQDKEQEGRRGLDCVHIRGKNRRVRAEPGWGSREELPITDKTRSNSVREGGATSEARVYS